MVTTYSSGYRVAQVRVIFTLPVHLNFKKPLAYIEYFTKFSEQRHGTDLYVVSRSYTTSTSGDTGGHGHGSTQARKREAAVVCLDSIRRSCHLIPEFTSQIRDKSWNTTNILDVCSSFYVNHYISRDMFQMFLG